MGFLRFRQSVITKNTFIDVDVGSLDGSAKDARQVQSWGGPASLAVCTVGSSSDYSDDEDAGEADDWGSECVDRITTAFFEDDSDVSQFLQGQANHESLMESRSEPLNEDSTKCPKADVPSLIPQPAHTLLIQRPGAMLAMIPAPVMMYNWNMQMAVVWTLSHSMPTTQQMVPQVPQTAYAERNSSSQTETSQRNVHFEDGRDKMECNSTWTCRMLRNIPNDYVRQDLLDLLDAKNIESDFVYLPMDWNKQANLGYAFVNCVSYQEAVRIGDVLNGFSDWTVSTQKVCEVVWGKPALQSLQRIIERFRNSPVMHPDVPDTFKPMVFNSGKRVTFPAPTLQIQPPRHNHSRGCK